MNLIIQPIDRSIDKRIVDFINKIYEEVETKEWVANDEEDELYNIIDRGRSFSCVCMDTDNDRIAGIFLVNFYDIRDEHFYGHFCNLSQSELEKTAVMDLAMVDTQYRGNRLQQRMMDYCEAKLRKAGFKILLATVHPDNKFSLDNALLMGYDIVTRKNLYGGWPRYILKKSLD